MPREGAGVAVSTHHHLGPQAQSRFVGLQPSCRMWPRPAPSPVSPSAWSPVLVAHTTDNPAMQSGSLIANSFYGSWAHLCHHMQKGKKNSHKKEKTFLPAPSPQTDSKRNICQGFSGRSQAWSWDPPWGLPLVWARQSQGARRGRVEQAPWGLTAETRLFWPQQTARSS